MLPLTLLHFFLWCNVFRVGSKRELLWSGVFIVNTAAWLYLWEFSVIRVFLTQAPFTLAVIAHTLRDPRYHGIACERINPDGCRRGPASPQ